MNLKKLLKRVSFNLKGNLNCEIEDVVYDSRKVKKGSLFVCLNGENTDGHNYASEAMKKGAVAIVCERELDVNINQIIVNSTRCAFSKICANLYDNPQESLKLIAITGTNGKTTTSFLLSSIIFESGKIVGTIGTQGSFIGKQFIKTDLTTPDPQDLFKILKTMVDNKVEYVVMEASAHALFLDKLFPIIYDVGVFTNFTQDHLDFFKTMENYKQAKLKLFSSNHIKSAVLNFDDMVGIEIANALDVPFISYGLKNPSDVFAIEIEKKPNKTSYVVNLLDNVFKIDSNLLGDFNIYNTLAACSAASILGFTENQIKRGIEALKSVPGRLNSYSLQNGATAVIDFAHTPDGVENVLKTLKAMPFKRIITVFGCGGNRDKKKRPLMGNIAEKYSDFVVLTSDNPRFENPELILDDIEHGMKKNAHTRFANRETAVCHAIDISKEGDVVAILGKGAEEYQDINGVKAPYNDYCVVMEKNQEMVLDFAIKGGKIWDII